MIPLDWADLPGETAQLEENVKQAELFKSWMESSSQGRLQVNWRIHPTWIRMSGSSSSWLTPNAFPPNSAFGDAAIAASDSSFDFSNIDAIVFFLPKAQAIFLEGSQGAVRAGLERPFRTAEGDVPAFAVTGKYFEQVSKNHWSAWAHFSLIWMGMAELFDSRSNGPTAPVRAIPSGNMAGFDIMASQDGPNRQLSGWLRFLLDWLNSEQVYCKKLDTMSTIKLSLEPIGNSSSRLKMAGVQVSDTKMVIVESRRLNSRFDCTVNTHLINDGVIVYVVDTTQGHVTGETLSLVSPKNRTLRNSYCNTPTMQDPVMKAGEFVDILGLRVKVVESGTFDTIEISRL